MANAVREKRDIEQLVIWSLVDNGMGSMFADDFSRLHWSDYGGKTGGSSWTVAGPKVQSEDAVAVAQAIAALPADPETGEHVMAALIVQHGRTASRPDWCEEGVGHAEQKRNKRGQLMWRWDQPGRRRGKREPVMEWVGETQARVDWWRAKYDVWWIGLASLVEPLNRVLVRFEALSPAAPEKPWLLPKVHDADGNQVFGLYGQSSAARTSALQRRGSLELEPVAKRNIHSSGGAIR